MTSKPQVGKNLYNQALARGRAAKESARNALRRIVEESPGPQTQALLITKTALALIEIGAVFEELDEIGRNTKQL